MIEVLVIAATLGSGPEPLVLDTTLALRPSTPAPIVVEAAFLDDATLSFDCTGIPPIEGTVPRLDELPRPSLLGHAPSGRAADFALGLWENTYVQGWLLEQSDAAPATPARPQVDVNGDLVIDGTTGNGASWSISIGTCQ